MTKPIPTLVYGSCVARDIIRVVPEPFELTGYIARQSWVSAFTSPVTPPELTNVASAFQARNVRGDFESNATDTLDSKSKSTDVLVIDIASDRHGVVAFGGGYASITPDHRRAFNGIVPGGRIVPFASDEHRELFECAVNRGTQALESLGLLSKSIVIRAPFTDRTTTGEPMTASRRAAARINDDYDAYYAIFERAGLSILELPDDLAIADPQHAWGLGQDHYIDAAYHWLAEEISRFARHSSIPAH